MLGNTWDDRHMASTPTELVTEFCALWSDPDPETIASYFAENAVYTNVPQEPMRGRSAITQFLLRFAESFDGIDFIVHRQISDGNVVMNERTDVLRRKDGVELRLPVMGVFEIVDGRIAAWRDYFDQTTISAIVGTS